MHFVPGVPVKPMLAKPTLGVGEVSNVLLDACYAELTQVADRIRCSLPRETVP